MNESHQNTFAVDEVGAVQPSRFYETPWKVTLEARRRLLFPAARMYFAYHGVAWTKNWMMFGLPLIQRHRGSEILIGDYLHMKNWFSSNPLGVRNRSVLATLSRNAVIQIGERAGITGVVLCAKTKIQIGDRIRLGANCTIIDTDFHPISASKRAVNPRDGQSEPVIIGDDVFIGMNSVILKGVTIGDGAVIGAGSVVSRDVPAGTIAAGNPARIIRGANE